MCCTCALPGRRKARNLFSDGALEAEKVLPELVTEDSRNGYKAVRYNLLPLMTLQAMKEQQQIKELTAESRELRAENADLRARLERLEKLMFAKEALAQR
jgi:hypothetical protein